MVSTVTTYIYCNTNSCSELKSTNSRVLIMFKKMQGNIKMEKKGKQSYI